MPDCSQQVQATALGHGHGPSLVPSAGNHPVHCAGYRLLAPMPYLSALDTTVTSPKASQPPQQVVSSLMQDSFSSLKPYSVLMTLTAPQGLTQFQVKNNSKQQPFRH